MSPHKTCVINWHWQCESHSLTFLFHLYMPSHCSVTSNALFYKKPKQRQRPLCCCLLCGTFSTIVYRICETSRNANICSHSELLCANKPRQVAFSPCLALSRVLSCYRTVQVKAGRCSSFKKWVYNLMWRFLTGTRSAEIHLHVPHFCFGWRHQNIQQGQD